MKTNLYVIYDTKARRTTEPFSCPTDSAAKRNFCMGCFEAATPVQDCVLFKVGYFACDEDDPTCFSLNELNNVVVPVSVEEIQAYNKIWKETLSVGFGEEIKA